MGFFQHDLDGGLAHDLSCATAKPLHFQEILDGIKSTFARAVELKRFANNRCFLRVEVDIPSVGIIEIACRRKP